MRLRLASADLAVPAATAAPGPHRTVRDETPKAVAAFELATISKVAKGCELIVASLEKAPKWLCEAPQECYHGPSLKLVKTLLDNATFQNLKLICRNYHSTHHGPVHSDY